MPAPPLTFRPLSAETMMLGGVGGGSVGSTVSVVLGTISGTTGNCVGGVVKGLVMGCMVLATVTTLGAPDDIWLGVASFVGGCPK